AKDPVEIAEMLEAAVTGMQARAAALAGRQRDHTPTREHPFVVVLVDEVAFLTAYHPDKVVRDRVKAALATLTTQGRPSATASSRRCKTRARRSCRSATCSRTRSLCDSTSPSKSTWCSVMAHASGEL